MWKGFPTTTLLACILVTLAVFGCENGPPSADVPSPPPNSNPGVPTPAPDPLPDFPLSAVEERIWEIHDDYREPRTGLMMDVQLAAMARTQAKWMAEHQDMTHDRPASFSKRLRASGFRGAAGENVAYGYPTPEAVMRGWWNSAGHKRNILGNWDSIGVGVAQTANGQRYWCVVFGARGPQAATISEEFLPEGLSFERERETQE